MQLCISNCAGVAAPFLYLSDEGPRYIKGHSVTLGLIGVSAFIFSVLLFWFAKTNRARDNGLQDSRVAGLSEEEIIELGEESPRYRFTL